MASDRLVGTGNVVGDPDELFKSGLFQLDQNVIDILVLEARDQNLLLHQGQYSHDGDNANGLA